MVGQKELKIQFEHFDLATLPRTLIFLGDIGSGRKTFAYWLIHKLKMPSVLVGNSADDIRGLTQVKVADPTAYIISDVDQLSIAAQNSLLKTLEETPENMYFMLTATQEDLVIPTILSRCFTYRMCNYSRQELLDYLDQNYTYKDKELDVILDICTCPGDINLLLEYDIGEFMDYVRKVHKNIAIVSGANSFKIGDKINLADDSKKFDLGLFWRAFMSLCMKELDVKNLLAVQITSEYYADLRIKGINKQIAFDNWILAIRKAWM